MPRGRKMRKAQRDGDIKELKRLRAEQKLIDDNPVGRGCEKCPEHSLAACFGDKCATKCCGPDEGEYKPTQVVPVSPERQEMRRGGGRKTRRKRRKKRRKSRKNRKKTKRRRKRRRKKSKKVRRK